MLLLVSTVAVDLFVAGGFVVSLVGSAVVSAVLIVGLIVAATGDVIPFLVEVLLGAEAMDGTAFQALASPGVVVVAAVRPPA